MTLRTASMGRRSFVVPSTSDRGFVLLETALAIPILLAVTVALAWCLSIAATSAALGDAARTAARSLARGEAVPDVLERARAQVDGATVGIESASESVVVVVTRDVSPPVPILTGLSITVSSRVAIPREWT
jgi:Flp pilus assembly protein TadG